ncbi:MAG TPA: DUF4159 domain-containing protein [Gemmatimonadaceae bacterium]|jgi:hypothetical protein|nr:DUF4159 domain-containing protein [Gemmatimonadaceae bacterium]
MSLSRIGLWTVLLGSVAVAAAGAQRRNGFNQYFGGPEDYYQPPAYHGNPQYDGRFTFARIKYRGFEHFGREGPGWSHDYPDAEENFTKILRDITIVHPFVEAGPIVGSAIVTLDDPALFKYPVSYMSEPGGWHPNEKEIAGLRKYLLKGGFMIFDDFREGWGRDFDWTNLRQEMARALPNGKWVELTGKEPIFHSFFDVDLQKAINPTSAYGTRPPTYWGIYEDNDPKKRLMVIGNVDNDIGESWQWSAAGFIPISASNETYKLGVNYVIYALTH